MGTMEQRPDASPTPPPQAPADEPMSFDEYYRRHGGRRLAITSSARRAPAPEQPASGLMDLLRQPIALPGRRSSEACPPPRRAGAARWYAVPTIRRLATWIAGLLPGRLRRSKAAELARRNPGLAVWLMVFAGVGAAVVGPASGDPHPRRTPERYRAWLQARGQDAVRACIAEIGLKQSVMPTVRAVSDAPWIAGTYSPWQSTIAFNSRHEFSDAGLLAVAAHESVHALFDQHALQPGGGPHDDFNMLVEETAAEILGAHIAGDAWGRMGGDGDRLQRAIIEDHRRQCDLRIPGSIAQQYFASAERDPEAFGGMPFYEALVHYGPLELVDEVARICEREPLPLEAARAISRRFIRPQLAPRDRPILDSFECRRQARWN